LELPTFGTRYISNLNPAAYNRKYPFPSIAVVDNAVNHAYICVNSVSDLAYSLLNRYKFPTNEQKKQLEIHMLNAKEEKIFKFMFLLAALWNLTGAVFGYFNTAYTFQGIFGRELTDPLYFEIYQGTWGTTFVYFFGYLLVAHNPVKHSGIVIVGGIGKLAFAAKELQFYLSGIANPFILIIIVGDFIFLVLFAYYFFRLFKATVSIL
jgi:hypothetical protein